MSLELPSPEDPSPPFGRGGHPFFLHEMIHAQGSAVRATIRAVAGPAGGIPPPPNGRPLLLTGLGTSFHAALAAAGGVRGSSPWPALALDAFEVVDAPAGWAGAGTAVVFSSSGETALTLAAQRCLREAGVPQILISGAARSQSSEVANLLVRTRESEERAWVHTVSYTTAIAAAATLFSAWSGQPAPEPDSIGTAIDALLAREAEWRALAETLRDRHKIVVLGSASGAATAREAALKLREGAARFAASAGVEEFLHGILPSIDDDGAVLAVAETELEVRRARTALRAAERAGARTALFARTASPTGENEFRLPPVPSPLEPVAQIIPFQLLVYWLAVGDRRNPDVMGYDDPRILAARRTYGI